MAETFRYLLGPHGVLEGTEADVRAAGYDPWQSQLFTGVFNPEQFGHTPFDWSGYGLPGGADLDLDYATGYVPDLLDLRAAVRGGTATDLERQRYDAMVRSAQAIPLRDAGQLSYDAGTSGTGQTLSGASPDLGGIMLRLADRIERGEATDQERQLFQTTEAALRDQNWRASVPQPSDAFNPMGDQFFQALTALTMAAGGAGSFGAAGAAGGAGAGAGAGAAAGASAAPSLLGVPLSTLSTIGQIGTYGGLGANVLGTATDQDWLRTLGLGLGVTGGLAGGLAGLGSVLHTGVSSLTDAARLASSAGRLTGAVGRASGVGPLQQAASYLGQAGQVGSLGAGVLPESVTDWSTERGGPMEWDYSWDYGGEQPYDNWSGDLWAGGSPTFDESGGGNFFQSPAYQQFTGWGGDERQTGWYQNADLDTSGAGGGLLSTLGSLGSSALGFLGRNAGWLGPAASALGGLGAGALGANASRDASAAQTAALNRGIDLQTAQWLQQQANQAPWLEAGRTALGHLTGRMAWEGPPQPGATPAISGANYALPSATPGWTPQSMDANAYRWTPGQGPRAADYRYTPGAVPTLQGAELLANDPGYQFRQDEARRALEASALARGAGMSGATLAALGRQSQDLASQEYGNAWQRAAQQAQMREGWAQQASQMGFGQAMDETRLREQVNQIAAQQGWSQAQADAAFREQMAQQSSQQGFTQALQGQQWNQQSQQQWDQDAYNRQLQQSQIGYGRDQYQNQTDYERQQQAYKNQIAELTRQWNQFASVAGTGQTAVGQLGTQGQAASTQLGSLLSQLGTAGSQGALNQGNSWMNALANVNTGIQGGLGTMAYQRGIQSILGALNR